MYLWARRAPLKHRNFGVTGRVAADLSRELTLIGTSRFGQCWSNRTTQEAAFLKMMKADPEGVPEWKNNPRVTILGDAVHCMTPAGGMDANTALKHAALLGRLIADAGGWRSTIALKVERDMRVYTSENVKMSFEEASGRFNITESK